MAIEETGSYVGAFSSTVSANKPTDNPGKRADGAGEIRKLKAILKDSFPAVTAAVTATHTELNYCDGVTSAIQTQINQRFRTGDLLASFSATTPLGWARNTDPTWHDRMMRLVTTSAVQGGGGSHSPTIMNVVPPHTHSYSGSTGGQNANHTHGYTLRFGLVSGSGYPGFNASGDAAGDSSASSGGASTDHGHSYSGSTASNAGGSNWTPRYMDFALISKS